MKKKIRISLVLIVVCLLSACGNDSTLKLEKQIKETLNVSTEVAEAIRDWLDKSGNNYEEIIKSENNLANELNERFELYDVIDENDKRDLLVIRIEDQKIACLLDDNYTLIQGMLDNSMGIPMPENVVEKKVPKKISQTK